MLDLEHSEPRATCVTGDSPWACEHEAPPFLTDVVIAAIPFDNNQEGDLHPINVQQISPAPP